MNKGTFTYGLLQYHHSQLLGEVLNIGLVVYFPDVRRLEFIYPEKLIRLKFAYPDVPEKTIKAYFKYFESKAHELNESNGLFHEFDAHSSLNQLLETEFLAPDSSVLQFGNFRTSVLYTQDIDHIISQLYNLYFSVFLHNENNSGRIDEIILLKKYRRLLDEYASANHASRNSANLFVDYSIRPTPDSTPVKFDLAWKAKDNLHLVRPVSFDLSRTDIIQKKAYQFFGQFLDLQEHAKEKSYLFDVILAKPKDQALFKAYDNAVRLLEKPERVKLIEEEELSSYSKQTAEAVLF
jgi:hypothetical protein